MYNNHCALFFVFQLLSEDFQGRAITLIVKPTSPTAFFVDWRLSPPTDDSVNYSLTYSTQHKSEVKLTGGNNLTLTGLIECASYTITVRCLCGADENPFGGPFTSMVASTSHTSSE